MKRSRPDEGPLVRRGDRIGLAVFVVSLAASVIVAAVLPFAVDGLGFYLTASAVATPFVLLGAWEEVRAGRWIRFGVSAVLCIALYFLDWRVAAAAAMLLIGSDGVSACANILQRLWLLGLLGRMERCGADRSPLSRLTAYMFNVPAGVDTRNIRINRSVVRDRFPWRQMASSMMPALILMLLVWMFSSASAGFRADLGDHVLLAMALSMYASTVSVFVFVLGTLDVRLGSGSAFRPFDGLRGTLSRMAVPAVVALVIILVAIDPGWNALLLVLMSAAFCLVVLVLSMLSYVVDIEPSFVAEVGDAWAVDHPTDFDAGFDGRGSAHRLDDGVPGTPRRPADSCFDRRKY